MSNILKSNSAFGIWSGGHVMKFGRDIGEKKLVELARLAFDKGITNFITSDVYLQGKADLILKKSLQGLPRNEYTISSAIGHDFYFGKREGSAGFQRFTNPSLRHEKDYLSYLDMAVDKTLERLETDHVDLLMLHNPDKIGYSSPAVWNALEEIKKNGKTKEIGIAPGPANGFLLDLIDCFEKYSKIIDWAMIILNPFEPWPMENIIPIAEKNNIRLITRVVDYGGFFHGNIHKNYKFSEGDHRAYRPAKWLDIATSKWEKISFLTEKYNLTPLQLSSLWNLHFHPVSCVVPTLIEETHEFSPKNQDIKIIEDQLGELANLPKKNPLTIEDISIIREIGDNTGTMELKGASTRHTFKEYKADHWSAEDIHINIANKYKLDPSW